MTLILGCLAMCLILIVVYLIVLLTRTHSQSQQMMSKMIDMTNRESGASRAAVSQVAQSAVSVMTEATTRLSADQLRWTETMVLGRPDNQPTSAEQARNVEIEREPIPGVETFDGLPDNIRESLEREAAETRRLQAISQMPPQDLEQTFNPPATNGHSTPEQVLSQWIEG